MTRTIRSVGPLIIATLLLVGMSGPAASAVPAPPSPPTAKPAGPPTATPAGQPTAKPPNPPGPAQPPGHQARPTPADQVDEDVFLDKIPAGPAQPEGFAAMSATLPPTRGQAVPHQFDIVVANLFDSPADIPPGQPAESMSRDFIDARLSEAGRWWSDNTGLAFDMNTGTRYATINTTCATIEADAFAAMGKPFDVTAYSGSASDLMIFQVGLACGDYGGIALTVPTAGDVFAGGVFEVVYYDWVWDEWTTRTIAHEFGHTLGLGHSNVNTCTGTNWSGDDQVGPEWDGTYTTGCGIVEYADISTIMGNPSGLDGVSLSSLQRHYLGVAWDDVAWIDEPVDQKVFTISRYDLNTPGLLRGVAVSKMDDCCQAALEFHAADGVLFARPGVYLTLGTAFQSLRTSLQPPVGYVPSPAELNAPAINLDPGQPFVSQDGTVRLRTLSVDATTARVEVTFTGLPGLPGTVSVERDGPALTAHVYGASADPQATLSYQWFRNGQPVAGATGATFKPVLPDPNAVYRVEATAAAPGHAATTRYSRGIVPDDRRLAINNGKITMTLLDADGGPVDCSGMPLSIVIESPDGLNLGQQLAIAEATGKSGLCDVALTVPLTGDLRFTASTPVDLMTPSTWQSLFWEPVTASAAITATGARAGLIVGLQPPPVALIPGTYIGAGYFPEPGRPQLVVGAGGPPAVVTVSVTDDTGAPAAGVPVTLAGTVPGLVFSPAVPVTDEYGFARATADWDRTLPPPAGCLDAGIDAEVPGVLIVSGSPARLQVCSFGTGSLSAWFEGDRSVLANGQESVTVHLRAWDDLGNPVTDQADRIGAKIYASANPWYLDSISISPAKWNPAGQDYVMTLTSTDPEAILLSVWLDAGSQIIGVIEFVNGPAVRLDVQTALMVASDGSCESALDPRGWAWAWPVDAYGHYLGVVDGGVVFSVPAGSPLRFTTDPVVARADRYSGAYAGYSLRVTSSVPGTFEFSATTADGRISGSAWVTVMDAPVDSAASAVTLSPGPRLAGGTDAYTVTATLVSMCHLPVADVLAEGFDGFSIELKAADPVTGDPAAGAAIGAIMGPADTAHPGVYTATVTSKDPATYALTLNMVVYPGYPPYNSQDNTVVPVNEEPLLAKFVAEPPPQPPVEPPGPPAPPVKPNPPAHVNAPTGGTVHGSGAVPVVPVVAGIVLLLSGIAVLPLGRIYKRPK